MKHAASASTNCCLQQMYWNSWPSFILMTFKQTQHKLHSPPSLSLIYIQIHIYHLTFCLEIQPLMSDESCSPLTFLISLNFTYDTSTTLTTDTGSCLAGYFFTTTVYESTINTKTTNTTQCIIQICQNWQADTTIKTIQITFLQKQEICLSHITHTSNTSSAKTYSYEYFYHLLAY